jgi:hypothetical protein
MRLARPAVFAATVAAFSEPLHAQGDATADRVRAESTATRRSAERAARSFEQRRLRLLPNVASPGSGPGDVIIGRYRYAAGEADALTPPPAEPAAIGEARRSLLKTLDSASRAMPGDEWVRGRLVWYAIEAGDTAAAVAAARHCRDDDVPWWCDALLGLALHASHQFVMAERAFDRALAAMPDSTRCRWTDMAAVLDGEAEKRVRRTSCEQRGPLDARLWWLADPLHSVDGNELRSELFARRTFTVLHDRWRASHPLGWGADMREIVLRYAWAIAWSRDRTRERSPSQPGLSLALTGHEPRPAYDFFPDADALEWPYDLSDANWHLKRERATSHYAHPFAAPMRPLRHQIAQFRRGDSLLVVGAWDASDDTLFSGGARAALVVSTDDGRSRLMERSDTAAPIGVLLVKVPPVDHVASLELFAHGSRAAARARAGLRASGLASPLALSDILLLEPGEQPRTFAEALGRLLPEARLGSDRRVTLYWEVYGIAGAPAPRVMVRVSRVRASRARRLAEKLRLRDAPESVEIQWDTDAPAAGITAGSVTLDLRDRPTGTWRVSITVTGAGGETASTARDLVLEAR